MEYYRVKSKLFYSLLCVISFELVYSQESINTTGGNASGNNGSSSYSIGQVVYTTNSGTNGSVAQGVQQAYEISEITSTENFKDLNLNLSTCPNPTSDFLILNFNNNFEDDFTYQLLDLNSKILESKSIVEKETTITMQQYVTATYFLKIIKNNKTIKKFKIIKN